MKSVIKLYEVENENNQMWIWYLKYYRKSWLLEYGGRIMPLINCQEYRQCKYVKCQDKNKWVDVIHDEESQLRERWDD